MKKSISIIQLLVMLLVPCALVAQKEVTKTFKDINSIRINTSSGDCEIIKSPDASVTVKLLHSYDDGGFEPKMEQNGNRLTVKESFNVNSVSGTSKWTISVPDAIEIRFQSGSGGFEASNLKLDIDAKTGSGNFKISKVKGDIKATTGSGDFTISDFNGDLDANTGSGSVLAQNCNGTIHLNSGSGNIKLTDSRAAFNANTGSGDVISKNLTLDGASRFNSGSGNSQVILATVPKHDLSVGSGSGDAEVDFNGKEIVGVVVMKANKKNGRIEAPFEFDKVEESDDESNQMTVKKTAAKGNATNLITVSTGSGVARVRK